MRSILKLAWKNIKHGRGSFKGIVFLMMLLTFSFSGTVSNNDALHSAIVKNFDEAGVGDIIVYIYDERFTDDIRESLEKNTNVGDYTIKQNILVKEPVTASGGKKLGAASALTAYYDNIKVFNEKFNGFVKDTALSEGEIYVPYKVRATKAVDTGSEITVKSRSGSDEHFIVRGFYEDDVLGSTSMGDVEYVISEADFERIKAEKTDHITDEPRCLLLVDRIFINGAGGMSAVELKHALAKETDLVNSSMWTVDRANLMNTFEIFSKVGTRCVFAFTLMLFAIILITMCSSINSSIEMDYGELGVLKAQGFTVGRIRLVYAVQYMLALVIGAVLGIVVSVPVCMVLIRLWMNVTCVLTDTNVAVLKCMGLCLMIIIICMLFVAAFTRKIGRISPVKAISGEKSDVHFDSRLNVKVRKKPLSFFIALRQLNSRRKSYLSTTFIAGLMVFFLVCIMQMMQSFDPDKIYGTQKGEIVMSGRGGFTFEIADEAEKAVTEADSKAVMYSKAMNRMTLDDDLYSVYTFLSEDDYFRLLDGRQPKYDNEMTITKNLSEALGKKIGDTVEAAYNGKKGEYVITGYYQDVSEFGLSAMVTREGMEKLDFVNVAESQIRLSDTSKLGEIMDMLNDRFGEKLEAKEYVISDSAKKYRDLIDTIMNSLVYGMYAIIMIFSAVVVAMSCRRAFIHERNDIGIFKAIGFTSGDLRLQFAFRFVFTAVTGSVLGCIAGMLWAKPLINYILKIAGLSGIESRFRLTAFASPAAAVCLCFFVFAYAASRRVRKVEVRELISE